MTLPPAFAPLAAHPRFVAVRTRPDERSGKIIKEPLNWRTGQLCNPLDPSNQTTYANVAASEHKVGFVFDADDGLFFVDIDNALDGSDWSSLAKSICDAFPTAAVEISQSGTGLHIVGRYTGPTPSHNKKNIALGLELYTDKRFMLLGRPEGTRGWADADCTVALHDLIANYFAPNPYSEASGWTDEPCEEYGGPEDDAVLLEMMLASGHHDANVAFGGAVPKFEALWTADADTLAKLYPSSTGQPWDASSADAALAWMLSFWTGKDCERIRRFMLASELVRQKWEDRPEYLEMTIMNAVNHAKNVYTGGATSQDKPVIEVRPSEFDQIATEAENALIAAKIPIYQRGGLVTPVITEATASGGHKISVARLASLTPPGLLDFLCRAARFEKYAVAKGRYVGANPPDVLPKIILSREGEWRFPSLSGIITAPTLRPDGSLLAEAGYDPETHLLLIKPPTMPTIADVPTIYDAQAALAKLNGLLRDFPFADDASHAVALSALISPVVRGAMPVVPLHAVTAPTSGSGKSYLMDLVSALITGDRAPVLSVADKIEETDKRLTGAVLDGRPIVVLDNVNGELYSDSLCQAVERPRVTVRPLGTSNLITIETRATFFATGNNLRMVSDLARRTLICTIDPALERPELRTFNGDPFKTILANRGEYLAAALTVVRAYVAAGQPGKVPPLGSFEAWSDLVRSALIWLGCADPVTTQDCARADDPTITELSQLLGEWYSAAGSVSHTVKEILDKAAPGNMLHAGLRDAIIVVAGDGREGIVPVRLGNYLAKNKGRILAGLRLAGDYDRKRKQKIWRVVPVG